jgi:hypothetical protein
MPLGKDNDDIRVITNEEEDDDDDDELSLDKVIDQLGPCARPYWNMDQCLDKTNKNWLLCKEHVLKLKECWQKLEEQGLRKVQKDREMIAKLSLLKEKYKKSGNTQ